MQRQASLNGHAVVVVVKDSWDVFPLITSTNAPPVSSEDRFGGSSVDELGRIQPSSIDADTCGLREDRAGAARVVSRAFKALVTGKTVMKKVSPTHG